MKEITQIVEVSKSLQKNVDIAKEKGEDWQVIVPQILPTIVSLIQMIIGLFSKKTKEQIIEMKGLFDISTVKIEESFKLLNEKLEILTLEIRKQIELTNKIYTHLESSCLKKEDLESIFNKLSADVSAEVLSKVPNELMGCEIIQTTPFKIQRASKEKE